MSTDAHNRSQKLLSLVRGVSFLHQEADKLSCAIRTDNLSTGRKLALVDDYLNLTSRITTDLEQELYRVIEILQREGGTRASESFEYHGDYERIDRMLGAYLEERRGPKDE